MKSDLPTLGQRLRGLPLRRTGVAAWLWGEAGIGKTHTSRAMLRETPCRSLILPAALPLAELVCALPRPPRLRTWTQAALDSLEAGRALAVPAADVLAALLGQLAPFVLHLEDLHEADAARLELTCQLADAVARTRGAGLLVSSRLPPPGSWPTSAQVSPLERLSSQASVKLLEAEAGARLPAEAATWVYGRAHGNPLFTLEYFRLLARQGHLWNDGQCWRWRLPPADLLPVMVEALIERTLLNAGTQPRLAEVIGGRALLPIGADSSLLALLVALTPSQLSEAETELERLDIFSGTNFIHPLYREMALKMLPPPRRRRLARRALAALGSDPFAASAFVEAAELESAAAVEWLLRAAAKRDEVGDGVGAARLRVRGLPYADRDTAARLALEAAHGLKEVDVPEATRLAEQAAQTTQTTQTPQTAQTRSEAIWLLSELLAAQGQGSLAERRLEQLPPNERAGPVFVARLLKLRAQDNQRLIALLDGHPGVLAYADPRTVYQVGRSLAYCGRAAEALAAAEELLTRLSDSWARVMALKVQSVVAQVRADFTAMERLEREVLELARPTGNLRLIDAALFNRAMALGTLGRFLEQTACLEEALAVCLELGDPTAAAIAQVSLGGALHQVGEYQRAETLLHEARTFLENLDVSGYLVDCECALSALYRDWQPPHGRVLATRYARAALEHARQLGDLRTLTESLPVAALAEVWAGDPASALALADQGAALADQLEMPQMRQAAQAARGSALTALKRPQEALETLRLAQTLALEMGDLFAAHRAGLECDRLSGDLPAARQRLAWFEQWGLGAGTDLARRLFPELSLEAQPPSEAGLSSQKAPGAPGLRLDSLGPLCCGVPGNMQAVRGRKRRELLACLLECRLQGHPDVPRLALMDTLYPSAEAGPAASALKELVHQTRAALGTGVIQTTEGGYALGKVQSDAELFLQTGQTALWRGPYLGSEEPEPGGLMADTLYGALFTRAEALCLEHPAEAARVGRLLCQANPYDRASLALTLRALRAAGNHRSLNRFYAAARRGFLEVGETLPEDWATFLETHRTQESDPA